MLSFLLSHCKKYKGSLISVSGIGLTILGAIWTYDFQQLTPSGTLTPLTKLEIRIFLTLISISLYLLSLLILTLIHYKKDIDPITFSPEERERILKSLHIESADSKDKSTVEYFTVGEQKWEATVYNNRLSSINRYPICKKHNLPFICTHSFFHCPEADNQNCKNIIRDKDHSRLKDIAESYIKKELMERINK